MESYVENMYTTTTERQRKKGPKKYDTLFAGGNNMGLLADSRGLWVQQGEKGERLNVK